MINYSDFYDLMVKLAAGRKMLRPEEIDVYYEQLKNVPYETLKEAVNYLVDSFEYARFPVIAEIKSAIEEVYKESPVATSKEYQESDFCQRCENTGFYFDYYERICKFCQCIYGKRAEIYFKHYGDQEAINKELNKLGDNYPAIKGIKELNPRGFWELTQEEHNKWIQWEKERLEQYRLLNESKKTKEINNLAQKVLEDIEELMSIKKERETEEDDEEIPF